MNKPVCTWASISEKNSINGKKGDQTGKEVKVGFLYDFDQTYVIRCKNLVKRKRISKAAMRVAKNDYIGYGQDDRMSSFKLFANIRWNIDKIRSIKTPCNIDCSMLALCAVNFAFGKNIVSANNNSSSLPVSCVQTKKFKKLAYKKGMKLKKGDLVGKHGHVVVCCEDGKGV